MNKKQLEEIFKRMQKEKEEVTKEELDQKIQYIRQIEGEDVYFIQLKKGYYIWKNKKGELTIQAR